MSTDPTSVRTAARSFAARHAAELARELNAWSDTALLPEGRLAELAAILAPVDLQRDMALAEQYANRAIRDAVAAGPVESPAPAIEGLQRAGSTLCVLNADGVNRWSAQVQPGRTDDDARVADAECERIAAIIEMAILRTPGLHS